MDDHHLVVPQRNVPLPASLSSAAQALLALLAQNNGWEQAGRADPSDPEAWRAFVAQVNTAILASPGIYAVSQRAGIDTQTTQLGGAVVHIATPENIDEAFRGRVYLEMHGGGMVFLAGEACRRGSLREAETLGLRVVSVDYRVPPDHPYPAALDDCLNAYRALLSEYAPGDIAVGGLSGGGNLAAAMLLKARDEGLALPAALVLLTPEVDLTESGDSFSTLLGIDPILTKKLSDSISAYAGKHPLDHPYLSPLFGDFRGGFPPTFLQSGTRDLFLSNTVRMHRALRRDGVQAQLHIWEAMPHGGFQGAPEDDEVSAEIRNFLHGIWR